MSDLLTPLVEAYRSENRGTSLDTGALRARVLANAARGARPRPRRLTWLLPVAAAFVASASLAAVPAARSEITRAVAALGALVSARVSRPTVPPHSRVRRSPNSAPAPRVPALAPIPDLPEAPPNAAASARTLGPLDARAPEGTSVPESAAAITPNPEAVALSPSRPVELHPNALHSSAAASRSAATAPPARKDGPFAAAFPAAASSAAPPPVPPANDLAPDLGAYAAAHDLHFAKADYARALSAWTAYLARFPAGTFAPEARLNRAVCLARLGRTSEARTALTAIASGRYGSTGRAEAKRLLDALPPSSE
jgi:hypothetical protein